MEAFFNCDFLPFLELSAKRASSEDDSQPFLPRSLAQKPQQGRIRLWSYAKAKPESGSKEHFPHTANFWSRNRWEWPGQWVGTGARQDSRPWLPPEMPLTLHRLHPGVGPVLHQPPAGEQMCGGCENPRQPKCFFQDTVKAWRGNLYWWAVREIPFGFVLL